MSPPDDFLVALARVYDLLGDHPRNHPVVRVALAEARSALASGGPLAIVVEEQGLARGEEPALTSTARLARALATAGAAAVEVDEEVTAEELERFLAGAREGRAGGNGACHIRWTGSAPTSGTGPGEPPGAHQQFSRLAATLFQVTPDPPPGIDHELSQSPSEPVAGTNGRMAAKVGVASDPTDPAIDERSPVGSGPTEAPASRPRPGPYQGAPVDPEPGAGGVTEPRTFDSAVTAYARRPDSTLEDPILAAAAVEDRRRVAEAVEKLILASSPKCGDPRTGLARRLADPEVLKWFVGELAQVGDDLPRKATLVRIAVVLDAPMAWALGQALAGAHDRRARRCFADTLVALGPIAVHAVEDLIDDSRWHVARSGTRLLPDVAGRRAVEPLARMLEHADARVRREAVSALARIGGPRSCELLAALLDDGEPQVRSAAALAIGAIGGDGAGSSLTKRLDSERDPEVTVDLIRSLARLGYTEATPQLERRSASRLFSRAPTGVRIAALRALWSFGTASARTTVMHGLDDRDPEVRGAVRSLLGGR